MCVKNFVAIGGETNESKNDGSVGGNGDVDDTSENEHVEFDDDDDSVSLEDPTDSDCEPTDDSDTEQLPFHSSTNTTLFQPAPFA